MEEKTNKHKIGRIIGEDVICNDYKNLITDKIIQCKSCGMVFRLDGKAENYVYLPSERLNDFSVLETHAVKCPKCECFVFLNFK